MRSETAKYYDYTIELKLEQKHGEPKGGTHFIRYTPPLSKLSRESLAAALRVKNVTAFFGLR